MTLNQHIEATLETETGRDIPQIKQKLINNLENKLFLKDLNVLLLKGKEQIKGSMVQEDSRFQERRKKEIKLKKKTNTIVQNT